MFGKTQADVSADNLSKTNTLCILLIEIFPGRSVRLPDFTLDASFQCWLGTTSIKNGNLECVSHQNKSSFYIQLMNTS